MIDFTKIPSLNGNQEPGRVKITLPPGEIGIFTKEYIENIVKQQIDSFVVNKGEKFAHPFYLHRENVPICIGSCFGVVYRDEYFILTAAHLFDELKREETDTYSFGRASAYNVPTNVITFYEGKWLDADIALMPCSKDDYPIHFIPIERCEFSTDKKFFYPLGFPCYANEVNYDRETGAMSGACIVGTLNSNYLTPELVSKLKPGKIITPFKHLGTQNPEGFSGGILFTVDWETELPPHPRFEGMLTDWEEPAGCPNGFSGVSVSRIIDAIEQHLGYNQEEEHFSTQSII